MNDLLPGPIPADGPAAAPGVLPVPVEVGQTLLGRYRLLSELGRGGNGLVFEAQDEQLDRRVAVKVLHPQHARDTHWRELFQKESRLLARLGHPGIVSIHAFDEDPRCRVPVLVMDLVQGVDLGRLLRQLREELERDEGRSSPESQDGPRLSKAIAALPPQDPRPPLAGGPWFRSTAQIVREIVRVLESTHEKGVIHRDLTPRNVLVGPGGWPVLLDFGLGGTIGTDPGAVTQGLHGTPSYLAPEQVDARRTGSDPRTDVYQVGLLLYELMTLAPAFGDSAAHVGAVLERIRRGLFRTPRARNKAVPREIEAICLRAIELDPARRYPSARDLGRDLDRWLDGLAPHAGGARWPGRLGREGRYWMRRHPVLASAGISAVLVGVLVISILLWFTGHRSLVRIDGAWRRAVGAERTETVRAGEPVRPDDWLGAKIDSDVRAYVYGLSVIGGPEPDKQHLLPVSPLPLMELAPGDQTSSSLPVGDWGLRVEPGLTEVAFVQASDEAGEGLIVIAGAERMLAVEAWFDRMTKVHEREWSAFPGIPRDRAEGLFIEPGEELERGIPLSALDPEELARQAAGLDPSSVLEGSGWEGTAGARLEIWFPVVRE